MNSEEFFKSPPAQEFFNLFQEEFYKSQRPPNQVILDDFDFCKMLKISKRHSANLRATKQITYSKSGGKIYYLLSDVLDFIKKNEIKSVDVTTTIFKSKNQFYEKC